MAFDTEFAPEQGATTGKNYMMHVQCFAAWELERDRELAAATTPKVQKHRSAIADELNGHRLRDPAGPGTINHHERDRPDSGVTE